MGGLVVFFFSFSREVGDAVAPVGRRGTAVVDASVVRYGVWIWLRWGDRFWVLCCYSCGIEEGERGRGRRVPGN